MRGVRLARLASLLFAVAAAAACGGSGESGGPEEVSTGGDENERALPAWVVRRLDERKGADVALLMGNSDFSVGRNRVTFAVVEKDGELVQAPTAAVRFGLEDEAAPGEAQAELVPVGPHTHPGPTEPHDHPDVTDLYTVELRLPKAGRYWLVVDPAGESIQGAAAIEVRERTISAPVGGKAPPSENPTLADAPARTITTARPPDVELLRYSVAESLADGVPFVVVFATPAYCQSRTCGPTVEVADAVRAELAGSGIRFIHIEVYEDNDPDKGYNRWMREWSLPSEPWVFLVDASGVIRSKFEGSVSVAELEEAVRRNLRTGP